MAWMCTDDKELTKGGNLKRPITWVIEAWEDIPAEMVKRSFLKTGISNGMDAIICGKIHENHRHQQTKQKKPGTQMSV